MLRFMNKTFAGLSLIGIVALAPNFATAQTKVLSEAAQAAIKMPPMGDVIKKSGDEMEGIIARTLAKLK